MTSIKRPFAWWFLAESAARRFTVAADVARSDAEVERVVTGSALHAAGRSLAAMAGRAWTDSRTARALRPIAGDLAPLSMAGRVRVAGLIVTVGSLTALVLQALQPMRTGRLDSVLPAAAAVAGALIACFANPVSRAIADRRAGRAQSRNP